ncbi:hypothetical protein GQX73_g874 [Xylaria multiplex]|uniref:chitinase n=1 Tax=Xylaria multiplex TaxID=323545 RepID=A0A7C8NAX6_9PEZI|nr:hypothetical protein GQX73_g874 [Xylaria multiplex]
MRYTILSIVVILFWSVSCVHAAVDINGTQVVELVSENDPSPIGDSKTYVPDQYNCPLPCSDYANTHSWTPYTSVDRLRKCYEPSLLQFSASQSLEESNGNALILSCTLGSSLKIHNSAESAFSEIEIENPKKSKRLHESSLNIAPACAIPGIEAGGTFRISASRNGKVEGGGNIGSLLEGMQRYFDAPDNCDETFVFAYHKSTVASIYIGAGLGKSTVKAVLGPLSEHLKANEHVANQTIVQLCDEDRQPEKVFGISINNMGSLVSVQKDALGWSQGNCAYREELHYVQDLSDAKVFNIAGKDLAGVNSTVQSNVTSQDSLKHNKMIEQRATCRYVQVAAGDSCASLARKCRIGGAEFSKYNPKANLCSTLQPGDYVCCSAGDPYKPPKPKVPQPSSDGTCATHLIINGDSCDALARRYGLTSGQIESFNRGKTWAWTTCRNMLIGYNMCLSKGSPPLPPPQQGAECGPLVPGTKPPADGKMSLADLNPCPLKACCSNWGFCGPFAAHCEIHAPEGGGPGTKLPEYESTCVSNCGNEIKMNSGPPAAFERIGYYESWNLGRDCLWLKAENANTDGSYTHMHWGFAGIDPNTWKPIITDPHKQWEGFKALENMKRIVSFGGWAYSTEPATYNILRRAIIDNRETFTTNLAQFVRDEGIDGIDIDWEYPGAPDILVGGQPIGKPGDGVAYLRFLTSLKSKLGRDKLVSIAAPASYWYLKAFPIDRIAAVIDYIVYMTYDLHGQWDYGNVNAFDSCPSGKCIRSHVNLTETRNSLSISKSTLLGFLPTSEHRATLTQSVQIVTKAGVPNNKIFVGESSYGRSFHMAQDGCWGPMCDFTGSRTESDASPGRCTQTKGYVSNAEINEIIGRGVGAQTFHDDASNTDIMLYDGDYISYMTPTTKSTRRADWKDLNFGGSIDWAVDLQSFTSDDMDSAPGNGAPGKEGCIAGVDETLNSANLCEFSCSFDFCPESLCKCTFRGKIEALPPANNGLGDIIAWDDFDVDLNRLCKFACKYGYCPEDTCTQKIVDPDEEGVVMIGDPNNPNYFDYEAARAKNAMNCLLYKDLNNNEAEQCYSVCKSQLDEAKEEGRTTNYGCVGFFPLDKEIPWQKYPGTPYYVAPAKCVCDNWLVNEIADFVLEAMPAIAQIGCYILMSSLKLVLDIGASLFTGGAGRALSAGLDMAATAAQVASYVYPEEEDPEGAFSWWLSPCGGTAFVPDELKKIFDVLSGVPTGRTSFKTPKKIRKGSGRKGDNGNPTDRSRPRPGSGTGPNGSGGVSKKKRCRIPAGQSTTRLGRFKNTLRKQDCVSSTTRKVDLVITSLEYAASATPMAVVKTCSQAFSQACFHYSSAIRVNPSWATLTCDEEAATTAHRLNGAATAGWSLQHNGAGWLDAANRREPRCQRDEYPPAYLLYRRHPAFVNSGRDRTGQLVRWLPASENGRAGQMWKGACFAPPLMDMSDSNFEKAHRKGSKIQSKVDKGVTAFMVRATVDARPEFSWGSWGHANNPPRDYGLWDNTCLPAKAANDPGFVLLTYDPCSAGFFLVRLARLA